jgi:hypothetical protein
MRARLFLERQVNVEKLIVDRLSRVVENHLTMKPSSIALKSVRYLASLAMIPRVSDGVPLRDPACRQRSRSIRS